MLFGSTGIFSPRIFEAKEEFAVSTCDISCANVRTPSYFALCEAVKVAEVGAKPYLSAGIACATPINSCSKRFSNSSCACTGDIWVPAATFALIEPVCAEPESVQPPRIKAVQTYRRRIGHLSKFAQQSRRRLCDAEILLAGLVLYLTVKR